MSKIFNAEQVENGWIVSVYDGESKLFVTSKESQVVKYLKELLVQGSQETLNEGE